MRGRVLPGRVREVGSKGIAVAVLAVGLAMGPMVGTAQAGAVAPPTLSGEAFHSDDPDAASTGCPEPGQVDALFTASGTTTGPHLGTFFESGRLVSNADGIGADLDLFFTIDSPIGHVTGSKHATVLGFACSSSVLSFNTTNGTLDGTAYTATIYTDAGAFRDRGTFDAMLLWDPLGAVPDSTFDESFQSQLDSPTPLYPTSKAACKHDGWRIWTEPSFKNEGACIAYVKL